MYIVNKKIFFHAKFMWKLSKIIYDLIFGV
jgi:hypothetical protein